MFANYDYSRWPLVIATFSGETVTMDDFNAHIAEFERLLAGPEPFSIIFDVTNSPQLSINMVMPQVRSLQANKANIEAVLRCSAIVVKSDAIRNLLSMVLKIFKPTKPNQSFSNLSEAKKWVRSQ